MNSLREKAYLMRMSGKSYNEIQAALGVPKSTSATWFRGLALSEDAKTRLRARVHEGTLNGLVQRNKMQTVKARQRALETQRTSSKEIRPVTKRELMYIGTALYWAEGYKRLKVTNGTERTHHAIRFVNTDPVMIKVFIRFLRDLLSIPIVSIKVNMRLYDHIHEIQAKEYWMKQTGLAESQFRKTTYLVSKASKGIRSRDRLPWGTLQIEVADTAKFHVLLGWIEGMKVNV